MKARQNMIAALLGGALSLGGAAALAHGEHASPGGHGSKMGTAAAKEQKPWGIAGDPKAAKRQIEISMGDDMRFNPAGIELREGETVRFVLRNKGRLMHELVIGTKQELDAHADMMARMPGMAHEAPHMAHVAPGQRGEIVWQFNRAGEFDFGCLIAGHYQAGMVGKIKVVAQ